jgi:hypothetical protein
MAKVDHFVPGKREEAEGPLARYLRPVPAGVATAYVKAWTEPDQIVLDAFCQGGTVLAEAVQNGRKAIAVSFNPLAVLAVRSHLTWPDSHQMDAGFTRLRDSPKLGMRLRECLEALYSTPCPGCQQPIVADYFVWDREREDPVEKGYRCEFCRSEGLARVEPADLEALDRIETRGFHYWYILDRVATRGQDSREQAQKLLDLYTPRNLYALASLLIKIEALFPESPLQDAFKLILLACLDSCSNLYSVEDRTRPHRLHPPARFLEPNVWRTFEAAYQETRQWSPPSGVRLTKNLEEIVTPDLFAWAEGEPPNAFLEVRTVRSLVRELPEASVALIAVTPPHPDPISWSLSYLWSGWLLGPKAVASLKPLLGRKRTDWTWYHKAMTVAFRALHRVLQARGSLVLVFVAEAPALVEALLLAASGAGFELEGLLYQPNDRDKYRLSFVKIAEPVEVSSTPDLDALAGEIRRQAVAAAEEVLRERGEPLAFPWLRNAIYERLSHTGHLRQVLAVEEESFSALDFVAEQVEVAVREAGPGLVRLDVAAEEGARPPLWWLREPEKVACPLGDRVEEAIREILQERPTLDRQGLEEAIYPRFPGFLTPEEVLIEACLESYSEQIGPDHWQLRAEDEGANRQDQRVQAVARLTKLGQRLGYAIWLNPAWRERASGGSKLANFLVTEELGFDPGPLASFDVLWHEEGAIHAFVLTAKATLGHLLLEKEAEASEIYRYLVIPAERASLVDFKLRRNPLLGEAVADGNWRIVKYCHLAWLAEAGEIDRHDLKKIVGLEPIIEQAEAQIPLF